ncbi:MAG: histidinol dehydrogenase [Myxococcota bacterium]
MRVVHQGTPEFDAHLRQLRRRGDADLERVEPAVREILAAVRAEGDAAVHRYTEKFDGRTPAIRLSDDRWRELSAQVDEETRAALTTAAERISAYHGRQRDDGFQYSEHGITLGMRVRPVRAAGIYAPGGKARYPSSVLMSVVPAKVAGVERIVVCSPSADPVTLAAAEIAGATELWDLGGAQAIAALAYGTETVEGVDTIVGPGNIYVACAKRLVFGTVNIDQIAGPSEILVVADDGARPDVIAADLLSQAEHDEDAYALLVTDSEALVEPVVREVERQLALLSRQEIAKASIRDNGAIFVTKNLAEAARIADILAPEHLALSVRDPEKLLEGISAAGAAFLGEHTPEAAGDYAAGPSHVLPTGGAARFGSPLGVYDFVVRTSLVRYSQAAIDAQGDLLERLARLEGLEAHARAVAIRRSKNS